MQNIPKFPRNLTKHMPVSTTLFETYFDCWGSLFTVLAVNLHIYCESLSLQLSKNYRVAMRHVASFSCTDVA